MKFDENSLSVLPREVPGYHERQAAHLRSLAANATTVKVKARLLAEARKHEYIAQRDAEADIEPRYRSHLLLEVARGYDQTETGRRLPNILPEQLRQWAADLDPEAEAVEKTADYSIHARR